MKAFTIGENDAGQRLDRFVKRVAPALPPSLLQRYIRIKRIKINHKRAENATVLSTGDIIEMYINDEFFPAETDDALSFLSAGDALDIIYEDENILLVNKPQALVVHEDDEGTRDTLIARIQKYLYNRHEYNPAAENAFAPALCNRIDRNTGGIVIAAKNAATLRVMNSVIRDRLIKKEYLCIVHGCPKPESGTLKNYLKKDEAQNRVLVYDAPQSGARTALTKYNVIKSNGRFSLVGIELLTGRTHQIRAQMAHAGHPLLGDTKYGTAKQNAGTGYRYQALWSYRLTLEAGERAEHLGYLNGRVFEVQDIPFLRDFERL